MKNIKHADNCFYIGENLENAIAEISFVPRGEDKIVIDHTYVSTTLRGQGVGAELVNKVVELARQENKKIVPSCSYAEKVMHTVDEYSDVLSS